MFLSKSDFGDDDSTSVNHNKGAGGVAGGGSGGPLATPIKSNPSAGAGGGGGGADATAAIASPAIHRARMAEQKQKALDKRKSKNFVGGLVRTNEDGAARPTTPSSAVKVENRISLTGASGAASAPTTPAKPVGAGSGAGGGMMSGGAVPTGVMTFTASNTHVPPPSATASGAGAGAGGAGAGVADLLREREKEKENKSVSQVEKSMLAMGISPVFDPVKKPVVDVKLDFTDMRSFLMNPIARGSTLQCFIVRNKKGLKNKMYPSYELYLDSKDQRFLLAGKKLSQNSTSYYLVSMDKANMTKESASFMGKVRSNFMGTEFTIFDKGVAPKKVDDDQLAISMMTVRQELGYCVYESNLLGNRGPRKMTVAVPAVGRDGVRTVWRPLKETDTIGAKLKASGGFSGANAAAAAGGVSGAPVAAAPMPAAGAPPPQVAGAAAAALPPQQQQQQQQQHTTGSAAAVVAQSNKDAITDLVRLENKPPKWNDQVGAFVLNFNGRVTMASVKNFQLVDSSDPSEQVLLQFGRVQKDKFTMDFSYPLSVFQAFSICLSSFDYKIACE